MNNIDYFVRVEVTVAFTTNILSNQLIAKTQESKEI